MQFIIDNTGDGVNRVDNDYKVVNDIMINKHTTYKYETPYWGPFVMTPCWTNCTVSLKVGAKEISYNIRCINQYKSDTKVEDYNSINMYDDVNI